MLVAGFVVALLVDFGLPVALGVYLHRRFGVSWRFFLYGALVFAGFQLFTRIPLVTLLGGLLRPNQLPATYQWAWLAGLALTAGIFEEVGRYVGYRWLFSAKERTWDRALMFGVGHGGLEAMGFVGLQVLSSLLTVVALSRVDVGQLNLPEAQAAQVRALLSLPWWMPLVGAFERVGAMAIQVSLAVVVLQAFVRGRLAWLWAAIAYHALVDFASVGASRLLTPAGPVGSSAGGVVAVEGVVAVFALVSVWLIFALRPQAAWASPSPTSTADP